jgi:glycosyltransferase involved in cell wall biosynthesis
MHRSLSIVLAVRGAAPRLPELAAGCLAVAAQHAGDYELIVVVAGDDEATHAQAQRLAATHAPVIALRLRGRGGFRQALRDAWGLARGALVVVLDPLQAPVGELPKLLAVADDRTAVFGARSPRPVSPGAALHKFALRGSGAALDDPALRLFVAPAALRDLLSPDGPDARVVAEVAAAARRRGLTVRQVAVAAPKVPGRARRSAVSVGALVVAGCLWLLRRLIPGSRR